MSDIIKLLPDSVANKIAAGEVIQRPSSALKELVENAVDAGAHEIKIIVRDGGKTLLQVVDDGKGMSETDARMAFERHATSKISEASDLFSLHTMGFRGEALPSICAIAEVELRTRREEDTLGTRLVIDSSKVIEQEPVACARGSNFMVKRIFANFPARRKFLKSDSVELNSIMREFERLALVNEHIRFSIDTGTRHIDIMPGSFKQRINDIWKNNLKMQLLPVEVSTSIVNISGFVSHPANARRHNPLQFLIVNGRNMRHPYFHKAIVSCFEQLIPVDSQPNYFIRFEVDPSTIDVNIHPTKTEIKFENEVSIRPILYHAVRASLGKYSSVPTIDFTGEEIDIRPPRGGDFVGMPDDGVDPTYNPFDNSHGSFLSGIQNSQVRIPGRNVGKVPPPSDNWEKLYETFTGKMSPVSVTPASSSVETDLVEEVAPMCIQFADKYIVSSSRDGLMLIDQHRAHVKILYEKFLAQISSSIPSVQHVMFPETVLLDEAQQAILSEVDKELRKIGYILEYVEDNKWQLTGVPSMAGLKNHVETIIRILDSVCDESFSYGKDNSESERIMDYIAHSMARSSAIRGGIRLSSVEMEQLISELFLLPEPNYTPDGNPIFKLIDNASISAMFT